ncbi:MAG: radical SAM protein [Planctomycetota bacterium]
MDGRVELLGLTRAALRDAASQHLEAGHGAVGPIHRMAFDRGVLAPELCGLGRDAAEAWHRAFTCDLLEISRTVEEPAPVDGALPTAKAVFRTSDGFECESVRIPIGTTRQSQCLSSQVGCAMGCTFCETGRMGLLRSLRPAEITAQVVTARARLGWRPDTLVFQGMGEPLDAADAVLDAIRALTDPGGLGFGMDRITVCTSGHVEGIRTFADAGFRRVNLSLSLNAADDETRARIMPITRRWPLADVREALAAARPRRNWQLGIHWCLMPGINDRREDAARIAAFCAPLGRVMVHLIPYNPGTAPLCRAPREEEVERFVGWLRDEGLPVRRRITKGRDVMAACGQLGNRDLRRRNPRVIDG